MRSGDPYTMEPIIAACHPKSPAAEAELKAGDKIVEIEGAKIGTQSELRHQLGPRYAGDKIALVVMRGSERLERTLELTAKLLPYIHPFLGVLPRRDGEQKISALADGGNTEKSKIDANSTAPAPGVIVREVYPNSPAATAGIRSGDRIISLAGQGVADRFKLALQVAALEPQKQTNVEIERDGKRQTIELKLATLPEAVPDDLPPARDSSPPADAAPQSVGNIEVKIPEAPNNCLAYVPEMYNSHVPYGLIVWLHPAGGYKADDLIKRWKPLCDANDMILLAPKSADANRWQRTELEFVRKAIEDVVQKYHVDPTRIVAVGEDAGGSLAYLLASQYPDLIRGVAAINAPMPPGMKPPVNDPAQRLAFFCTTAKRSPPSIATTIKVLREAKFPVTALDVGPISRPLTEEEWKKVVRWIDTLDRS
jgi:serine protease Do